MTRTGKQRPHPIVLFVLTLFLSLILNAVLLVQSWRQNIVVKVVDGDTIDLADGRRVRLLGIDAPEQGRCMSEEAQNTLTQMVLGKHVRLKNITTDSFGRILASVIIEDPTTWFSYLRGETDPFPNRVMVRLGLAKNTRSNPEYAQALKEAATDAQASARGIYSPTCRGQNPSPDCNIKGNLRAGKKTYFLPKCKNYDQTIVDTSFGDFWFCSEGEAQEAGFLKSATCP